MAFATIVAFAACSEEEDLGLYESIAIPSIFEVECGKSCTIETLSVQPSGVTSRIEWCEEEDESDCISINQYTGEITAVRIGEATIKAYSIDGSGVESNICTVCVVADNSGNLAVGGDFEKYSSKTEVLTEWSVSSSNIEMETTNKVSGARSVRLTGATATVGLYQLVTSLEPESEYEFGFTGRIQGSAASVGSVAATADYELRMTVRYCVDGVVSDAISGVISVKTLSGEYSADTFVRGRVTIPEGVTSAYIYLEKSSGIAYVDEVFIYEV